jgi:SepF-like predicted cell division protein (DUF552 family)
MIKNQFHISGSTDRYVELIGIAKDIVAGNVVLKDFAPLDDRDRDIFLDILKIIKQGKEPAIPNDFT